MPYCVVNLPADDVPLREFVFRDVDGDAVPFGHLVYDLGDFARLNRRDSFTVLFAGLSVEDEAGVAALLSLPEVVVLLDDVVQQSSRRLDGVLLGVVLLVDEVADILVVEVGVQLASCELLIRKVGRDDLQEFRSFIGQSVDRGEFCTHGCNSSPDHDNIQDAAHQNYR